MPIDYGYCVWVSDGDMVRLDPDQGPKSLVSLINCEESSTSPGLVEEPQIRESCGERRRDIVDSPITDIWQKVVDERQEQEGIRRDEK